MSKKYKLTGETINLNGATLYRIEALKDFGEIKKGDKGGFIESEDNLSHEGNAWVYDDAWVYGSASVYGNARVCGNTRVYNHACVHGDARVCGDALVRGYACVCAAMQKYQTNPITLFFKTGGQAVVTSHGHVQIICGL